MRKLVWSVLVVGAAVLGVAQGAWAGSLVEASGPVLVNGKQATVPVQLAKGDTVDTGNSTAVFESDAKDRITLDRGTVARSEGSEGGIEYLFLRNGGATADLSDKTSVGVAVSWASGAQGQKARVRIEAPAAEASSKGRFRALTGGVWLRNDNDSVWLPEAHSITLWRDAKRDAMCFQANALNPGYVTMVRRVSGGPIGIRIPKGASGCVESMGGNKTKVSNDLVSNKDQKMIVNTEYGKASEAALGPGGYAIIDNATGGITTGTIAAIDESLGDEPVEEIDISVSRSTKR